MKFLEPMLASPVPADLTIRPGEWVAEVKYDGHRLVVRVKDGQVKAWSRGALERVLPHDIREVLETFPDGVYDGELMAPNGKCYGVKVVGAKLTLVLFDVIEMLGHSVASYTHNERRGFLVEIVDRLTDQTCVQLSKFWTLSSVDHAHELAKDLWAKGAEGLILKRRNSIYHAGKRSKDWLKIKAKGSAVLTVTGFTEGKMGPCSVVNLIDEKGFEARVKARGDALRARFEREKKKTIGRKARIEFQERTPDGSYREPRWDRFEDE